MSRFPVTLEPAKEWTIRAAYSWDDEVSPGLRHPAEGDLARLRDLAQRTRAVTQGLNDETRRISDESVPRRDLDALPIEGNVGYQVLPAMFAAGPDVAITLPDSLLPSIDPEALDLDDREAVLGFVRSFGFLGVGYYAWPEIVLELEDGDLWFHPQDRQPSFDAAMEPLTDFRASIAVLRACALIARELRSGSPFSVARVRSEWPKYAPWRAPNRKTEAVGMLDAALNLALGYQRVGLIVDSAGAVDMGWEMFAPALFARIGLELVGVLVDDRPIKTCAYCGKWFYLLEGGSQHRQPRRDSKYHSPECRSNATSARSRKKHPRTKGL